MKFAESKKALILLTTGAWIAFMLLMNLAGVLTGCRYISISEAVDQVDVYQLRSRMLTEAMNVVGVCCPEDAVRVWTEGLKQRSAAYQYAVLSRELREKFAAEWEKNYPGWVTGISSPWVDGYEIVRVSEIGKNIFQYEVKVRLATSTGPAGEYPALLTVAPEDGFWRIIALTADEALDPYLGLVRE